MEPLNDAWEHRIEMLKAERDAQRQYLEQRWPGEKFLIYSPQAPIPQLDNIGKEGWELVSIQPVVMGANGDIDILGDPSFGYSKWTHEYLCTFKRRLPST